MKTLHQFKDDREPDSYTKADLTRFSGYKLAQLCELNHISRLKLAGLMEVSTQQVRKYMYGENMIPPWMMFKLCQYFNIDVKYFFPTTDKILFLPLLRDEYDTKVNAKFKDIIRTLLCLNSRQINMLNLIIYEFYTQNSLLDEQSEVLNQNLKDIAEYE